VSEMHPNWYYREFGNIFGSTRRYAEEVATISQVSSLSGERVEEVGVGLGSHLAEVLKHNPRSVVGVDLDDEACRLSRERFSFDRRVSIVEADGFIRRSDALLLYCFYCLPQQTREPAEAVARLEHLAFGAVDGREAWVEVMDVDRHLRSNLCRPREEIFRRGGDFLALHTEASETGAEIVYSGVMYSQSTEYRVPIARIGQGIISDIAQRAGVSFECYPLTESNRRALIRFF